MTRPTPDALEHAHRLALIAALRQTEDRIGARAAEILAAATDLLQARSELRREIADLEALETAS